MNIIRHWYIYIYIYIKCKYHPRNHHVFIRLCKNSLISDDSSKIWNTKGGIHQMLIWNYCIHNWQYVRSKFWGPNYREFSVTIWPNFRKRIHNHGCSHSKKIIHCWCDLPVKSFILFGADSKNTLWKILQTYVGTVSVPMVILHTSECVLCYTASKPRAGCPCSIDFNVGKKKQPFSKFCIHSEKLQK